MIYMYVIFVNSAENQDDFDMQFSVCVPANITFIQIVFWSLELVLKLNDSFRKERCVQQAQLSV